MCSCEFSLALFKLNPNTNKCESSMGTYVFAAFWLLEACVCVWLVAHMVWSLFISHQHKALRLDVLNIACAFNLFAATIQIADHTIAIVLMLGDLNAKEYLTCLRIQRVILNAIYAAAILIAALTFGVAVDMIAVESSHFRSVNSKQIMKRVVIVTTVLGTIALVGVAILGRFQMFVESRIYYAAVSVFLWLLYQRILKYLAIDPVLSTKEMPLEPSRGFTGKMGGHVTHASAHHNATMAAINILASRFAYHPFSIMCLTALFATLFYAGRATATCNAKMAGVGAATLNAASYAVFTSGIMCVALFMRQLAIIRIARILGDQRVTYHNLK
eukprot:c17889_g1_i1.p1 GENE.c17889_g1_i1~~c17889_g1_i1.p1  ORF type:complete len:385 (+),score=71.64 c17889_g1_i1:167-1156(+)